MITRRLVVLLAGFLLAGCSLLRGPAVTPTRFYVLTAAGAPRVMASSLAVGLGPITFPAYLDRPELAVRVDANQIAYQDAARWAEPLKQSFARVLATDLSNLLGTERIIAFPWYSTTKIDYTVAIDVTRFEAQSDGTAILVASWTVGRDGEHALASNVATLSRSGGSAEQTAAALSALTAELAQQIAAAIPARTP